ncbi:hypothetical protein O6H91_23G031100 [Diphasiastrum complanatum]|nr:hypothetical protein O6H91_23G031100 [Diphasiastrum complanatum]
MVVPGILACASVLLRHMFKKRRNIVFVDESLRAVFIGGQILRHAVARRSVATVREVLARGTDANSADEGAETALHVASRQGNCAMIAELLIAGAKVNAKSKIGETPLLYATACNHPDVVDLLLCSGADPEAGLPLLVAAGQGNEKTCRALLEAGASVDARDRAGSTVLHHAVAGKSLPIVQLLLDRGADPNARSSNGNTPILQAVDNGCLPIVGLLVQHSGSHKPATEHAQTTLADASTNKATREKAGRTLLHQASKSLPLVQLLLDCGSDPNARSRDGSTLMLQTVTKDSLPITGLLDQPSGVNKPTTELGQTTGVDATTKEATTEEYVETASTKKEEPPTWIDETTSITTSIEQAKIASTKGAQPTGILDAFFLDESLLEGARSGNLAMVKLCMARGVVLDTGDQHGWTALHIAATKGHMEIVQLLVAGGAGLNSRDIEGYTPLHCAAEAGHTEIVRFLVEKGANLSSITNKGMAPRHVAAVMEYGSVLTLLLRKETSLCISDWSGTRKSIQKHDLALFMMESTYQVSERAAMT